MFKKRLTVLQKIVSFSLQFFRAFNFNSEMALIINFFTINIFVSQSYK